MTVSQIPLMGSCFGLLILSQRRCDLHMAGPACPWGLPLEENGCRLYGWTGLLRAGDAPSARGLAHLQSSSPPR